MSPISRAALIFTCLVPLSMWACDDSGGDGDGDGAGAAGGAGGGALVPPETPLGPIGSGETAEALADSTGTTVRVPGATLTVPEGALAEPVTLTVESTFEDPEGDFTRHSPVFRFGPDTVQFEVPATIRMVYIGRPRPTVFFWSTDGVTFSEIPARVDGDTVIVEITRLGTGFVGTFGAPEPPMPDAEVGGAGGGDGMDAGVVDIPDQGQGGFGGGGPVSDDCADVEARWQDNWTEFEFEVLRLTNEYRAQGYNCDTQGEFGPAGPLEFNATLRCAARLHSEDMAMQNYFEHDSLDGRTPFDRMRAAGYTGGWMGENIAAGQPTPQSVVAGWMDSDGHCANIMNPNFNELGVGFFQAATARFPYYWTQNFGGR
ncbi:MAG: CAP domain-containing protein [Bradymonadia bacterium]